MEKICQNPQSQVATDQRFVGKVLVITGAGGQFGRAACRYFGERGARIAALDQNAEGLEGTFAELSDEFDSKGFVCDVTNASQVASVVERIVERFGRIDLLWNNAGYQGKIQSCLDYDPIDFANVMNINVTGMFIVLQAVARKMKQQGGGVIVNTASVAGMRGTPGMIAYASSKAAILTMTVNAAKELARFHIRVNSISPALIGPGYMWDRQNALHAELGPPYYADTAEKVGEAKINAVPMQRVGSVEEVLQSTAFLLSSESSYTTGINLVVDGGLAAGTK
ncbi:hypothetical protein FisN_18Hh060 [Fistulifera solaris]|uniref:Uncharacterized protein n=1 Tax=Fistulifera solaris TaxID=1519565 RepID=A0A1Z5JUZ8_FISSO|nr:hypothetical protein FisN_18Hh060 [Fistulifera solaris]|eukprot:GAX17857.1 hypothetical protein FisN_18Hh060 [Fistulifera solaris]